MPWSTLTKVGFWGLDRIDLQSVSMMTRAELADLLRSVNVVDVAKAAKVSTKTVYRLRHQKNAPSIDTALKLIEAAKRLPKKRKAAA